MADYSFDYTRYQNQLIALLKELEKARGLEKNQYFRLIKKFAKPEGGVFSKDEIINAYRQLAGKHGLASFNQELVQMITMKPTRTGSGVTPVTVLTKPFPCPGKCIFCPNDVRMPKSYLSDEPGAQRAERNYFDPYLQTYNRLQALYNIGHPIEKIELIILGGTWSYYPEKYQIWFIKECFRALNEFGTKDDRQRIQAHYARLLETYQETAPVAMTNDPVHNKTAAAEFQVDGDELTKTYNQVVSHLYVGPEKKAGFDEYQQANWDELVVEQERNEFAVSRSVGLVVETRPDNISEAEVIKIRRLGCTKTQIGFQSLQDDVLEKNHRGHDVAATRRAVNLLRRAGFKIHAHWMANLYGSTPEKDMEDFQKLFSDGDFMPDELKIYPTSLIQSAELMQYYHKGLWKPYDHQELLGVVSFALAATPEYCRLTRVIRDIPSTDIVVGNLLTNFREIAQKYLGTIGKKPTDIRSREIKSAGFDAEAITLKDTVYETTVSTEHFLQYVVPVKEQGQQVEKLLGFLRLSLPKTPAFIPELVGSALIREVHVYGPAVGIGKKAGDKAQHLGLGKKLMKQAQQIARQRGYTGLAVISAIGTREYYRKNGFTDGELYQHLSLLE